jgi:hypothetical protein
VARRFRREIGLIVAWLVFPLVPVILEDVYYGNGPDPREWGWESWVVAVGPLLGYGFLAGSTIDLPDEFGTQKRGLRRLLSRRSVWVAIGPWCGPLVLFALFAVFVACATVLDKLTPLQNLALPKPVPWKGTWGEPVLAWSALALTWVLGAAVMVTWSYGWLWPASAALRRAARIGRLRRAFYRGLSVALAFVGSLFGAFWAATSLWRSHFFDPRLMPLIVSAVALAATSGCGDTITYGEVRRRELFHAMLVAWVLGLALMWRWWSRRRPGPPDDRTSV